MLRNAATDSYYSRSDVSESFSARQNGGKSPTGNRGGMDLDVSQTRNTVLNGLPREARAELWPSFRRVDVAREQFILQQDDELEFVYFPETAVLSEFHLLDDGRMVEVAITGSSGAVGVSSLYESRTTSNCIQTTHAGSLLRIESQILRKKCRHDPKLPGLLHSSLDAYIRQISQRAVCNMYHSVEERFCTWLLLVSDLSGKYRLGLTHEQIARALGVYRPSVTCIALEMRRRAVIEYSRGVLSIVDRRGLEMAACDCYYELAPDLTIRAETSYRS